MSYKNTHDTCSNLTAEQDSEFTQMTDRNLSRRGFISGMGALGIGAFMGLSPVITSAHATTKGVNNTFIGFKPIPAGTADKVVVPEGYKVSNLISWGDPIFEGAPEFDQSGKAPASAQAQQFGDNTDGMSLFPISEHRAVMAVNNEYINTDLMYSHKGEKMTADDVLKAQNAHGVSIFEIQKTSEGWMVDRSGNCG